MSISYDDFQKAKKPAYKIIQEKVSRCLHDNPDLSRAFIHELLVSANTDRSLAKPFILPKLKRTKK